MNNQNKFKVFKSKPTREKIEKEIKKQQIKQKSLHEKRLRKDFSIEENLMKMKEIEEKMLVENRSSDLKRFRSLTIGTAFGGTTEISVRANDGSVYWGLFTPVEVVELIHQLSSNIGCHLHLRPRNDFASWRDWGPNQNNSLGYSSNIPEKLTGNTDNNYALEHFSQIATGLNLLATGSPPHSNIPKNLNESEKSSTKQE